MGHIVLCCILVGVEEDHRGQSSSSGSHTFFGRMTNIGIDWTGSATSRVLLTITEVEENQG